ncbi:DNA-binding LacI/PurR family transcriptional regulator [Paraburkholderia bryophila]|uniref:DNA-binding LacI/PurR family transcriptional regulator n=1 Tax=Paraburkholderia bryophila TaxID=420952 RepID=A0A7Z0AZJ7_9BURK|nr:DNA-binding LacI/PurR family transcriptional regulator [Paraburkholderia bryophila]
MSEPLPGVGANFAARARIPDIARAAGVSTATVDRVLNGRENVRAVTAQRVLQAAAQLGYLLTPNAPAVTASKPMRIAFLLPAGTNRYLHMLGDYIDFAHDQWNALDMKCRVHYVESFNPKELADRLLQYGQRADGVVFMALEHPQVRDAVNTLADQGVPAITLISDLSNARRLAYVGIDNRSAGRTAALLLGRFMGAETEWQDRDARGQSQLSRARRARDRLSASDRIDVSSGTRDRTA